MIPQGGLGGPGIGPQLGGGYGGLAGYGPLRVKLSTALVYPRWEQPGESAGLVRLWSPPLIRLQIASSGSTCSPGPCRTRSEHFLESREEERKNKQKGNQAKSNKQKTVFLIVAAEDVEFSGSDPKSIPQVKTQEHPPFHQGTQTHQLHGNGIKLFQKSL